jgi:hypothetical protein
MSERIATAPKPMESGCVEPVKNTPPFARIGGRGAYNPLSPPVNLSGRLSNAPHPNAQVIPLGRYRRQLTQRKHLLLATSLII